MPRVDVGTSIDDIKDEGGPPPVPAGEYRLQVEHAEVGSNKAQDGKVLLMHHKVAEGEYEGRKIMYDRLSLKTTAAWKLKRFLTAADVPYEGSSFATEDVLGSKFYAIVSTYTTPKGRLVNQIEDYLVKS